GRVGRPIDLVLRTFSARYDNEWKARELTIDAKLGGRTVQMHTVVSGSAATTRTTTPGAAAAENTEQIDPAALLLPNLLVAPYQALAARLRTAAAGTTMTVYQPPQGTFPATVGESATEQIRTLDRIITARRTHLTFNTPGTPPLPVDLWADE